MSQENKRRQELEKLDKASLIEGYLLLEKRLDTLQEQINVLKQALGIKANKTSRNSSLPPSQEQKANLKPEKKAKRGPKKGHAGQSRQREDPDEIVECRAAACSGCGHDLSGLPQHEVGRHQIIDLPSIRPVVREVVRYGRYCPACQSYQRAAAPTGYEQGQVWGPQIQSLVLYLHYAHPLSYGRVQAILREMTGLKIAMGTLVEMVRRAQKSLKRGAAGIRQHIQQSVVVGSDETGVRVNGQNQWQWVFQSALWTYYVIRPSRGTQVIREAMGEAQPQVWVSDVYSAQINHPAQQYQICLAHQLRDLQYVIDTQGCVWAGDVQALLRHAIHLHKLRDKLSERRFGLLAQACQWKLTKLLETEPVTEDSQRLWRRFHKHRSALLLFLERADVPPTNNASEQALRNSVIYRKVTGGFRTAWAAETYAHLLSLLESARRQSRSVFEAIASALAPHPQFSWIGE